MNNSDRRFERGEPLNDAMSQTGKAELRRQMRARRRALTPEEQRRAAVRLAVRLSRLNLFGPKRRVGFYFANDGEIDPAAAMRHAAGSGALCLVPVVPGKGRRRLRFGVVGDGIDLRPNRFGIPEPVVSARRLLTVLELDLLLLPLVAFDACGNRLGMGGGFYDATLAMRSACRFFRRPAIIGIAHECQKLDRIVAEPWDIPLDRIVTDRRVYTFSNREAAGRQ